MIGYYALEEVAQPAANLLLDNYPGASVACWTSKLRGDYNGPCLRVRRSSDDAEFDVNFLGNDLDLANLISFCGSGDGFVRTYYDQSGNGRHLTQTNTLAQPQIVSAGAVITGTDGNPVLHFDGVNDFMATTDFGPYPQPSTRIMISTRNLAADGNGRYMTDGSPSHRQVMGINGTAQTRIFAGSINDYPTTGPYQTQSLWFGLFSGASSQIWIDGLGLGTKSVGSGQLGRVTIGSGYAGIGAITFWNGTIQGIIAYPSDQTANRAGIESEINSL